MFKLNADGVQIKRRTRPPQFDEIHKGCAPSGSVSAALTSILSASPTPGPEPGRVRDDPAVAAVDRR